MSLMMTPPKFKRLHRLEDAVNIFCKDAHLQTELCIIRLPKRGFKIIARNDGGNRGKDFLRDHFHFIIHVRENCRVIHCSIAFAASQYFRAGRSALP